MKLDEYMAMPEHQEMDLDSLIVIEANLGAQERHLGQIASNYRSLASKWLLATYAGIGFVLANQTNIQVCIELLIAAISFGGSIGIYSLWRIDILNYHRLLESSFEEAQCLELKHPAFPKYRNKMSDKMSKGSIGLRENVTLFYLMGLISLLASAMLAIVTCFLQQSRGLGLLAVIGGVAIITMISFHMYRATKKTRQK